MQLKETVSMMNSTDYKERFKAEFYQLDNRINGLSIMLDNYKNNSLKFTPKCSYELLYEQLIFMKSYISILKARAIIEGIEL